MGAFIVTIQAGFDAIDGISQLLNAGDLLQLFQFGVGSVVDTQVLVDSFDHLNQLSTLTLGNQVNL